MTLNQKQFDQLATKDDLRGLEDKITEKFDKVLTATDEIKKKFDDHETEHTANLGAHKRMQGEINDIKKQVGLKPANAEI